jgi:hypothetical protein
MPLRPFWAHAGAVCPDASIVSDGGSLVYDCEGIRYAHSSKRF